MNDRARPPRLARWIVERSLPKDVRDDVSGDLTEVFRRDALTAGARWARLRYWRKSASFVLHFGPERCRDLLRRGVMPPGMSWLEVKLALRMLVRYPGLSLAGALGLSVVIACGTAAAIFDAVVHGTLPFEGGHRVVAIENWDTAANRAHTRALHDFVRWRDALTTIRNVGAYRLTQRNLSVPGRAPEAVRVAEISAAAFDLARTPTLMGRYLTGADEGPAAAPVMVIGEDAWTQRFDADPLVLGRTVQLSDTTFTVVGVMPRTFGFPVNERYWIPLRANATEYRPGGGPELSVFGLLADGVDLQTAQAELTAIGQRAAADFPETHERLRPRVAPYTEWFFAEMQNGESLFLSGSVVMLLGIVCANVAVLVYARTATRRNEIAVRTALGARRGRIVWQMFIEGLALACVAAVVGLAIASAARQQLGVLSAQAPFWVDVTLTSGTVIVYVLVLTVAGGAIIGAVPALQATRPRAQAGLHQAASVSSWRIGRTYGVLAVVQVALAVTMLPGAAASSWTAIQLARADPGFRADEFLMAHVGTDEGSSERFRASLEVLEQRLESEPHVAAVTMMGNPPGTEARIAIEVEDGARHAIGHDQVSADYFRTFGIPVLAGRAFESHDATSATRPVVVNQTMAQKILDGSALGRRIRTIRGDHRGPWLEVVGVIPDFPKPPVEPTVADATLYEPLRPGEADVLLGIRVRGQAAGTFSTKLREVTSSVDRSLLLRDTRTIDAWLRGEQFEWRIVAWSTGLISLSALLLSATGLYALMAFGVTQRRREIGIRIAIGANPRTILWSIVSRAMLQLGAGITIGIAIAALLNNATDGEYAGGTGLTVLPAVALFVLLVGVVAAAVPARRGLQIQPMEALRNE